MIIPFDSASAFEPWISISAGIIKCIIETLLEAKAAECETKGSIVPSYLLQSAENSSNARANAIHQVICILVLESSGCHESRIFCH